MATKDPHIQSDTFPNGEAGMAHTLPEDVIFYPGSWRPRDPTAQEIVETEAEKAAALAQFEQEAETFQRTFAAAHSPADTFMAARDLVAKRTRAHSDEAQLGGDIRIAYSAFRTYQTALDSTELLYAKRMLTYGMNKEIHTLGWQWYDTDLSDTDWDSWFYGHGNGPTRVSLSVAAEELLRRHPEYRDMLEYGAKVYASNPHLGDDDWYAPDPYFDLQNTQETGDFDKGFPSELSIETATLLGIPVDQLTEAARGQLIKFGLGMTEQDYERIHQQTEHMAIEDRRAFAEAMLATQFGDDYGNSILTIVEQASPAQYRQILRSVNRFPALSQRFGSWFAAYDSEFAAKATHAFNERLTDVLTILAYVSQRGRASVDVSPNDARLSDAGDNRFLFTLDNMDEAINTLGLLDTSLSQLVSIIDDKSARINRVTQPNTNFSIFRLTSRQHGDALLYIRPEGANGYDRQYEYGNRSGVEASISFIVNPLRPHALWPDKDPDGVSFRFDREGRLPNEAPNSADRDPTRADGLVSLDVSSILGKETSPAARIGRLIAAGNRLRSQSVGSQDNLHHNVLLDQRYGRADNFARLARYIEAGMDTLAKKSAKLSLQAGKSLVERVVRPAA